MLKVRPILFISLGSLLRSVMKRNIGLLCWLKRARNLLRRLLCYGMMPEEFGVC